MYYIYRITNLVNGKTYIGQHKYKKLNDKYMRSGKLLKPAFKKYGKENFKKDIIEFGIPNVELANDWEQMYILFERAKGKAEYNIANGGNGIGTVSEETRKKLSEANKGENHPNYGKHLSEETKKNIGKANKVALKGRHLSEKHKANISKATKGEKNGFHGKKHSDETMKKIEEVREAYKESGRKDWNTFQKEYKAKHKENK